MILETRVKVNAEHNRLINHNGMLTITTVAHKDLIVWVVFSR